jgi:hypothetical protein
VTGPVEWREEPVGRHHDRKSFDCGSRELNEYLERYARQNHESGGAKTFVAVPHAEAARVLGYYSISPGAIDFTRVPAKVTRKHDRAARWYERFGALRLLDVPRELILPLSTIADAIATAERKRKQVSGLPLARE